MSQKVLLVEDDMGIADLYIRALGKNGYEIIHAPDGETGIELATQKNPDLILLDIMLPKKQGLTVLKELREVEALGTVKIYMLSALNDPLMRSQANNLGANGYIAKYTVDPPQKLVEIVKDIFDNKPIE